MLLLIAGIPELANQIRLLIMFTCVVGILTSGSCTLNIHFASVRKQKKKCSIVRGHPGHGQKQAYLITCCFCQVL